LSALVAKLGWELVTGNTLFAGALPDGVMVAPEVHLAGAVAGLLSAMIGLRAHGNVEQLTFSSPDGAPDHHS